MSRAPPPAATQIPSGKYFGGVGPNTRVVPVAQKRNKCRMCPTATVITDSKNGNLICCGCGVVLEARIISLEQEWRNFSSGDEGSKDKSRVGGPNDTWYKDATGSTSMIGAEGAFKRMSMVHDMTTAVSGSDRQLKSAFTNLRAIGDFFGIQETIIERTRETIKDMETVGCLKNRTGTTYILGVLYLALRESHNTMTLKELITYDGTLTEKDLGKAINRLKKLLAQRKRQTAIGASCGELIPRFCESLGYSTRVATVAKTVCLRAEKVMPNNTKGNNLAAACLLLTLTYIGFQVSPGDVAMAARAGLTSVMTTLNELMTFKGSILTSDLTTELDEVKASMA